MEPAAYNAFADMLAKFHTSSEWIKTLWLVAVPFTVVGVSVCIADVLKEAIRALARRPQGRVPLESRGLPMADRRAINRTSEPWAPRLPGPADAWAPVSAPPKDEFDR